VDDEVDVLADFVDGATQQVMVTVPELRGLIGEASPVFPAGPGYRALAAMQTTSGGRVTCGQLGTDVIVTPVYTSAAVGQEGITHTSRGEEQLPSLASVGSLMSTNGATDDREHAAEAMLTHDRRPPVDHLTDHTQHVRRRTTGHGLRTGHDDEEKRKARSHVREDFASMSSLENDAPVGVRTDGEDECIDVSTGSGVNGSPRDRAELLTPHVYQGSNPMIRQWGERQRKPPTY